jgi:16S rRNA (cytidine1402-2'-O)-methyltransferase
VEKEVSNGEACLFVVATPIGNLGDMSRRAVEVLQGVDLVAAEDTRHTGRLLTHLGIDRPMLALHEHNERERMQAVLERLERGMQVALVSDAGTPLISDPGFPLVRACHAAGIRVSPVPGPSALVAALCVSGLPTDRFLFQGFLPRKSAARREAMQALAGETATLVFYESSHRILDSLADLCAVFGEDRELALCRELTKLHETVRVGRLGELRAWVQADENQRKGEFVLVLAGAPAQTDPGDARLDGVLRVLLEEGVSVKQAAAVAARLAGVKRNLAYQRALQLHDGD